ncbi:WXG100 family type VII secretion target [Corynebacterium sp. 20_84]
MSAGVYAFRTSHADGGSADILSVMDRIRGIIDSIHNDVDALKPDWEGSEAELYDDINREWRKAARQINDILNDVSKALTSIKDANGEVRTQIQTELDNMT